MASPSAPHPPQSGFFQPGPPIPFNTQAHNFNSPSAIGFGFGGPSPIPTPRGQQQPNPFALAWGGSSTKQPSGMSISPTPNSKQSLYPSALASSSYTPTGGKKRRQEDDAQAGRAAEEEESGGRMIRKLGGGKRIRGGERVEERPAGGNGMSGGGAGGEDESDLGVILASLPPSAHLPILLTLLSQNPLLKSQISALIPPLDLTFCLDRLQQLFDTVKGRVPFSAPGLTAGKGKGRMMGFGFGSAMGGGGYEQGGEVSEGYVMNRLEGGINEFCSAAQTYLPHFLPTPTSHPSHPHSFLSPLTHLLTQLLLLLPSTAPTPLILSTLNTHVLSAWQSWVAAVDKKVNAEGGMFGRMEVEGWWSSLDGLSTKIQQQGFGGVGVQPGTVQAERERLRSGMEAVRKGWEGRVGWLIGKNGSGGGGDDRMDEDEEL